MVQKIQKCPLNLNHLKLVYFLDDMNMPEVDTYGTVQPHTLIREHLDYNHWYCSEL